MSGEKSQGISDDGSSALALASVATEQTEAVRYGVRFGEIGLLLPEAVFSEVVVKKEVYPLPNTSPWLLGILNDHGDMVPVYDLPLLFGLDSSGTKKNALLLIDQREYAVAIRISEYPKAVRGFEESEQATAIPDLLRAFVSTAYLAEGESWVDFRHRDFFMSLKSLVTS